ncbi:hypothetical protein [Azohydromonas caseinilytica]|uniref:Uncharacterized protein n=1 Tax=Azohydromonas caseinilytica TaxID=2728836 RepID=A0A848FBP1_9BURK|nr:hypothetical protein [Azohydromonas caseinilytica]NML15610.1 hypothetical protein [Azohydromonas caseinilytica]
MQTLIVAVLVLWASLYAAWTLMPAPWRRALLRRAQHHFPGLARRVPAAEGGCGGCGGSCGPGPGKKPAGVAQPIQLHLPRRR